MQVNIGFVKHYDRRFAQQDEAEQIEKLLKSATAGEYVEVLCMAFFSIGHGNVPIRHLVELNLHVAQIGKAATQDLHQLAVTFLLLQLKDQIANHSVHYMATSAICEVRVHR